MFELLDVHEQLEMALKLKRGRLQKAKGGGYAGGGAPFGYGVSAWWQKLYVKCNRGKSGTKGVPVKTAYARYDIKNVSEFMKAEGYKGRKGADFNVMLCKTYS